MHNMHKHGHGAYTILDVGEGSTLTEIDWSFKTGLSSYG